MSQGPGVVGLPTALLLLCIPGCLTLSCSSPVAGAVGESLSVQCRYEQKYKTFKKYWCRQPCLPLWHQIVETRGSDGEVRSGRVSITDHSGNLTFTVTMENLTADDEGKYRCGIATILKEEGLHGLLPDLFFQVQVFVSSASSIENSARAPGSPRSSRPSQRQGSLLGSVHFLLLVFLKVPVFLSMLGAVLWVSRPQRALWTQSA
ncbi:protein CD300H-like isoform X2 [Nycticebus coucang]|uniref:protein CD300H-like isoform X2 n=1 Tax=Nycticebus coucang TaxID=9470 RepID=UPI00234CC43F|nr:protein CD300H-like isoform X2 [Nycticebus coucang]